MEMPPVSWVARILNRTSRHDRSPTHLLASPQEIDVVHVHPRRPPDLDHVLAHRLDLFQIASHLVV